MFEVEVKVKVDDIEAFKAKINDLKCNFDEPLVQTDRIFVENGVKGFNIPFGSPVLRIRTENNKSIFTYKQKTNDIRGTIEHETVIDNFEEMISILTLLGFKEHVTVNKKRVYAKYDNFNICIDDVELLGSFVEIEIMANEDEKEEKYNNILAFIKTLGLNEENIVKYKYDEMVYNIVNNTK